MKFGIYLVGYGIADMLATIASAYWLKYSSQVALTLAFIGYLSCSACWLSAIGSTDSPGFTRSMIIYPIWAMLVGVVTGVLITQEQLGLRSWLGAVLGLISLILVATDIHKN